MTTKTTRRTFLQATMAAAAAAGMPWAKFIQKAYGLPAAAGLSDPALQPKFTELVPNALDPGFIFRPANGRRGLQQIEVGVGQSVQYTGLVDGNGQQVPTTVWGYGDMQGTYTWPGRTFEVQSNKPLEVTWENRLKGLTMPVSSIDYSTGLRRPVIDTSLHWAYSLHGYTQYSVENDGVPIVPHVHGGHNDFVADGNPEFFFSPDWEIRGPQWRTRKYTYKNDQPAGTVWYHDHALGITRLNVYAGMAGFYIIRDEYDTGRPGNPLNLPTFPYEAAFAIQDKMFHADGSLFYPTFPGDPFYDDFITGEGAILPPGLFPGGGPTALAEFFGDHMVVNGIIWPKMEVEPRKYRLRLLNGCDSRFLAVRFRRVSSGSESIPSDAPVIPFTVIGSDQGLAESPTDVQTLIIETGARYDIILDFEGMDDERIIMENLGGDEPFGGGILMPGGTGDFPEMRQIMAFDVVYGYGDLNESLDNVEPTSAGLATYAGTRKADYGAYAESTADRTRRVALFEGTDEFGRLQPLLGTAEPATDRMGNPIYWPDKPEYAQAVFPDGTPSPLIGQIEGSIAWHSPTTENPELGTTEYWDIFNVTGDAHPIHLHLVHFEVVDRKVLNFDSNADEDGFIPAGMSPADDGVYLVPQPTVQHNSVPGDPSTYGSGFRIVFPSNPDDAYGSTPAPGPEYTPDSYVENAPKDMVTALPGQITRIKAKFDKPGRYVWHCHILSHEDHEMMRVLHVGNEDSEGQGSKRGKAKQR